MSVDSDKDQEIEPGQDWEVDLFRPEDAEGVARLFRSVYGEGYAVRTYLEPQLLIQENAAQCTISSVARTPRGDVVGHNALFNSAAHPGTYESGAGAVHTAYRGGKGVFTRMFEHGLEIAKTLARVNAVFSEPVCNHIFSQKMTDKGGFILRALEVDLISAEAHEKDGGASGRVAAFLNFRTFRPRPHAVYLPAAYQHVLGFLYDGLDDSRNFRISKEGVPVGTVSRIRPRIFDSAGVARVEVTEAGGDFAARMETLERELRQRKIEVIQIGLDLSSPWVGEAVQMLRGRGYFLGGPLPRWFDNDGLLMQKILQRPNWEGICLYGDRAAQMLELVQADWERSLSYVNSGDD
ncbi:MAG: hypothetical protein QG552_1204 [Thermodesulfobacteriota bacterium]|nr:hypothetical protein [Thermodesulfobacteriota bacterium]